MQEKRDKKEESPIAARESDRPIREKRHKQVKTRFTNREYDALKQAAEQNHVALATFIRISALEAAAAVAQRSSAPERALPDKPEKGARGFGALAALGTGMAGLGGAAFGAFLTSRVLLQRHARKSRKAATAEASESKRKKESGNESERESG